MSSENRGTVPLQTVPVYTLYPGSYQGNADYGFHQSHPQASPPKYEDVISGKVHSQPQPQPQVQTQLPGAYGGPEQPGVILVAPVRYTKTFRSFGIIFTLLFLTAFISILIKVLSVR